jgi:hypothetical protein
MTQPITIANAQSGPAIHHGVSPFDHALPSRKTACARVAGWPINVSPIPNKLQTTNPTAVSLAL